jgi:hypothetical protein
MTRAMLVTVLHRHASGGDPPQAQAPAAPFDDVDYGTWYGEAVTWAAERGVTFGVGGGKFSPDSHVTYEQMITMFHRYYQLAAEAAEPSPDAPAAPADSSESLPAAWGGVSEWARIASAWAEGRNLIGSAAPRDTLTRAQAASRLVDFISSIEAVG